jgi:hypothetical protein
MMVIKFDSLPGAGPERRKQNLPTILTGLDQSFFGNPLLGKRRIVFEDDRGIHITNPLSMLIKKDQKGILNLSSGFENFERSLAIFVGVSFVNSFHRKYM